MHDAKGIVLHARRACYVVMFSGLFDAMLPTQHDAETLQACPGNGTNIQHCRPAVTQDRPDYTRMCYAVHGDS